MVREVIEPIRHSRWSPGSRRFYSSRSKKGWVWIRRSLRVPRRDFEPRPECALFEVHRDWHGRGCRRGGRLTSPDGPFSACYRILCRTLEDGPQGLGVATLCTWLGQRLWAGCDCPTVRAGCRHSLQAWWVIVASAEADLRAAIFAGTRLIGRES